MKGYLYNNEAIASTAIGYFMKKHTIASIPKILLILPFVLHEPSVRKLRGASIKRSIDEFILKNSECIINFNSRFLEFLPISINAITILSSANLISIVEDKIYYNPNHNFYPEESSSIGSRAKNLFKAIDALDELMKESDVHLFYLKLKIEL